MSQDPQTLLSQVACLNCYSGAPGMGMLLKLALLQQILLAQNPRAVTDPQTLLASANCYSCFANSPGTMALLELALLAQISANGSTGGGGGATNPPPGVVNPNGAVTGSPGAVYVNTANQTLWIQESATTANTGWVQFI